MELIHTSGYDDDVKRLAKLGATEADIRAMENAIAMNPTAGDVIPDGGGMRKVRFGFGGRGKSGGGRTIYYVITANDQVILVTAYAKADQSDITADDRKLFKALIKEIIE